MTETKDVVDVLGAHVIFWCPGCEREHAVRYIQVNGHSCWNWNNSKTEPTISPSILVNKWGCYHDNNLPVCHSYIKKGRIQFLNDCSHDLAGETVALPCILETPWGRA